MIFVDMFSATLGKNRSLYIHYLAEHVPAQVAKFGDLRPFAGQGLEHLHPAFKRILFNNTNRHVRPGQDPTGSGGAGVR